MGFASRVRFAIQAFSIDLGNLPALSELEEVLRTSEAQGFRHANGHSLFTHLKGTRRILEAWGQESRIQMAGLFHSVYSTPVYRKQLISIHRRTEIRGLIGTAGESLVYLFSRLSRETIVKSLGMYLPSEAYCVIDDSAGLEPLKVSRQQLTDLLIIHIANLADQSVGLAGGPGSWLHATGEMSRLLSASSLALPPVLKEIQTIRSRDAESTIRNEYRIGVAEIAQDRIKAVKHFDAVHDACSVLAEPLIWKAYCAYLAHETDIQTECATQAESILRAWGTPWDKRHTFEQWLKITHWLARSSSLPDDQKEIEALLWSGIYSQKTESTCVFDLGHDRVPEESDFAPLLVTSRFERYVASFAARTARGAMGEYPELSRRPWHEADVFPIVQELEAKFSTIRQEIAALPEVGYHNESERIERTGAWDVFMLYERGRRVDENCLQCPSIASIIDRHDCVKTLAGLIYISRLKAGTRIATHRGPTNIRLRCHLGIFIPESDCGIEVGGETRTWTEGRCLIFDDFFEHEAWNDSTKDRIVLICDLWHPELSTSEIELLKGLHAYASKVGVGLVNYWNANMNSRSKKRQQYD